MNDAPVLDPRAGTPADRILAAAIDLARAALIDDVGDHAVGDHIDAHSEQSDSGPAVTHRFRALLKGYVGWHWAVSITRADDDEAITVSEVALLPGAGAIEVPEWVPWAQRVRPDDLHPGDVVPTDAQDDRLVPGYVQSDDPDVESVMWELGLGRERVLSRDGRIDAAARWKNSSFGGATAMAKHAPAMCGTCGFYLPLAGSMRAMFGGCANEVSPADGRIVAADFGCGAHSEATVALPSLAAHGEPVYDTRGVDLSTPTAKVGKAAISPERMAKAQQVLAAVLSDALSRLESQASTAPAVRRLSSSEVAQAVRLAFAERTAKADSGRPARLQRSKKH